MSSSGTFAAEKEKVVYGLVFPIRTFEILYVQVRLSALKSAISRADHLHPSEHKHLQQRRREFLFLSPAEWPFCNQNIITLNKLSAEVKEANKMKCHELDVGIIFATITVGTTQFCFG